MKFDLSDFLQLDTKGLLAVNGGSPCGGSSSYSGGGGSPSDGGSPGGSGSSSDSGSSGGSGGGSCSGGNSGSDKKSSSGNVYPTKYGPTSSGWWGPTAWSDGSYLDSNGNRVYPNSNKGQTSGGGGSCSSVSGNGSNSAAGTATTGQETSSATTTSGGGSCGDSPKGNNSGAIDSTEENSSKTETKQDLPSYLICTDSNDVHCDIIAWNHAVDARLDPRGENGTDWDANNKTVDQIYNEHFVGKDVAFDGKQAGKKGYILYDWEGDGEYDHIEFGSISEDGLSYSYYSNNGFENGENYYTRSFAQDSNAHCDNNGNGIVRFIPLN